MAGIKQVYEERLHDKDVLVKNMQDRLQSYLYDIQGGEWSKVCANKSAPTQNEVYESSFKHMDTSFDKSSAIRNIHELQINNGQSENELQKRKYDVVMLHDSICHEIDINRMLRFTNRSGNKYTTYTIPQALEFSNEKLSYASSVILHVGINDLKKVPVEDAFQEYEKLVLDLTTKCDSLVLSLVTPCDYQMLQQKIQEFNGKVVDKFRGASKVQISFNSNFIRNGRLFADLFRDSIRLSPDGVSVLASNLKRALLGDVRTSNNNMQPRKLNMEYGRSGQFYPRSNQHGPRRQFGYPSDKKLDTAHLASNITAAILSAMKI